jgi:hypothetical protein
MKDIIPISKETKGGGKMKTRKFNPNRQRFILGIVLCAMLIVFPTGKSLSQEKEDVITATIECKELGRLNGEVEYQYDVTLTNNRKVKFKVDYDVIFLAGTTRIKTHNHSTLLIPAEKLTETNSGVIKESDWNKITTFRVEWLANEI